MDSEPDFKATPEQIAQITGTAIRELSKTHVIITKDELRDIVSEAIAATTDEMWGVVLDTYTNTGVQLATTLTAEQLKGYQVGGNLLHRIKSVVSETNSEVFGPRSTENTPETV